MPTLAGMKGELELDGSWRMQSTTCRGSKVPPPGAVYADLAGLGIAIHAHVEAAGAGAHALLLRAAGVRPAVVLIGGRGGVPTQIQIGVAAAAHGDPDGAARGYLVGPEGFELVVIDGLAGDVVGARGAATLVQAGRARRVGEIAPGAQVVARERVALVAPVARARHVRTQNLQRTQGQLAVGEADRVAQVAATAAAGLLTGQRRELAGRSVDVATLDECERAAERRLRPGGFGQAREVGRHPVQIAELLVGGRGLGQEPVVGAIEPAGPLEPLAASDAVAAQARVGFGAGKLLRHGPALARQVHDRVQRVVGANREVFALSHLGHDRPSLRILGLIDPGAMDERIGIVAACALDARAQAAVQTGPQILRP